MLLIYGFCHWIFHYKMFQKENKTDEVVELPIPEIANPTGLIHESAPSVTVPVYIDSDSDFKKGNSFTFSKSDWDYLLRIALDGGANSILASHVL
jgi:hypothetical protein